jgi:hypothetical protein
MGELQEIDTMPMLLHALLLAVLVPGTDPDPKCSAELKGRELLTSIQFSDGYRLEAPWEVLSSQHLVAAGDREAVVAELQLDRLIETDAITRQRQSSDLAEPVRLRLQAASDAALVYRAAETWCSTVIEARRGHTALQPPPLVRPGRVT